jgi:hypothetical protein
MKISLFGFGGYIVNRVTFLIITSVVLVFANFNVNKAQAQRSQTLHDAVARGDIEKVKSMLSGGADINKKNMLGGTPLHTALLNAKWEIAELLISKGPDLNIRDNHGRSPLFIAVDKNQKKIVELLLSKGVDVNAVARAGQNAYTLAKSKGNTEMEELLKKHGGQEPVLDTERGLYPGFRGEGAPGSVNMETQNRGMPRTAARPTTEPSVLSDPNEIKARVKTFAGLEKAIKDVNDKSSSELRQWRQTRYDNRSLLYRAVQTQFEEEMKLVRSNAEKEKAKKTIAAVDNLLSQKKERSKKVSRELRMQRRMQEQAQSGRVRGRGRTSGRGTRGRSSQRGQYGNDMMTDSLYDTGGAAMGMGRPERPTRPEDQVDPQTEDEIRRWTQADPSKKMDLAKNVHEHILAEMESIRVISVEEKAKKTTATIDGLMLARQERHDKLVLKMEEDARKAEERQQRLEQRYGRTSGRQMQNSTQQNTQQRGRSRRR